MIRLIPLLVILAAAPSEAYRLSDRPATVTACGSSPSISGTDDAGRATVGTGTVTSCTINFSKSYLVGPSCVVSMNATLAPSVAVSMSTIVVTTATTMAGKVINYLCSFP